VRHAQVYSMLVLLIQAHYVDVEMVAGIVNDHAERDHVIKLDRIATACNESFSVSAPALQPGAASINSMFWSEDSQREIQQTPVPDSMLGSFQTFSLAALPVMSEGEAQALQERQVAEDTGLIAELFNVDLACVHAMIARTGRARDHSQLTCYYCKKPGHIERDCRKRIRDQTGATNAVMEQTAAVSRPAGSPRPFSSFFERKNVGAKGNAVQFRRPVPGKKFRVFGKSRGSPQVHYLSTELDVQGLPEDAEIYVVDEDCLTVRANNSWCFDLA